MLTKTSAIVLRSIKLGDNKMIIHFLTCEGERLSCVVSIGRSPQSHVKHFLFLPLTMMEIEYDHRRSSDLQRLRTAHIAMPYTTLTTDAVKLSTALFLAEFIHYATIAEQQNSPLYDYMVNSLQWLDGCPTAAPNFHIVFMMRLSRFIGFFPLTDDYARGDYFDLRQARFVDSVPQHSDYLDKTDSANMLTLLRMDYNTMHLFRMSHDERNRITDIILQYYRLHVPAFPELKSLSVMRDIWRDEVTKAPRKRSII